MISKTINVNFILFLKLYLRRYIINNTIKIYF